MHVSISIAPKIKETLAFIKYWFTVDIQSQQSRFKLSISLVLLKIKMLWDAVISDCIILPKKTSVGASDTKHRMTSVKVSSWFVDFFHYCLFLEVPKPSHPTPPPRTLRNTEWRDSSWWECLPCEGRLKNVDYLNVEVGVLKFPCYVNFCKVNLDPSSYVDGA